MEEAIKVPEALQRNGGRPLPSIDMATALGRSPGSSGFRQVTAAANQYGFVSGNFRTQFALTDLGESLTQPKTPQESTQALVTAALTPKTFRSIYDYYKGKKFPEQQFFANTVVREFNVVQTQADACCAIFEANMRYVGLIRETPGGDWLSTEALPPAARLTADQVEEAEEAAEELDEQVEPEEEYADAAEVEPRTRPRTRRPNQIFIGHGRNHTPRDQLTKTLSTMGIPYAVAEDEATVGRPISQKVRETMEACGAAILIFSADIEYFDSKGNSVWRPSENVSHELGAASIMYDDRIILFKEDSVELASNFSGIGYITFERDALDAKVNDLLRELVAFKILKLSLNDDE